MNTTTEISTREDQEVEAPVPATQADALISVIERAAMNPSVDIDKMERLLQMQERVMARQAEMAFHTAMAECQSEMEPVVRNAQNTETRSTYAKLDAIAKAIDPIIHRHGFAVTFGTSDSPMEGHYRVTCKVTHREGHSEPYHADVPVDLTGPKGTVNKSKTHAFGSTLSYGRRYLKLLAFDIATEDDDGNAAAKPVETISEDQFNKLRDLLEKTGTPETALLGYYRVGSLNLFPAEKFAGAVKFLEAKLKKGAGHA